MKFGKSSSHNKGAASVRASIQKAGEKLKKQTADFYSNNTTPEAVFAGSKTAAALSQAFSEPVGVDEKVIADQLVQESGNCLNKLSYSETAKDLFNMMQVKDQTIDGFTYDGTLDFDERARVMASVGVAIVLCKIIHGAKSRMYTDDKGVEKKLIYVEDILEYIHEMHGNVITMDKTSNAAFERLSRGENVTPHERKLLGDLTTGYNTNFYDTKYNAMIGVKKENVGDKWASKVIDINAAHQAILAATNALIDGNARIQISSNLAITNIQTRAKDIAALMLSLVAMHILTYAITACLDFYYKMARMASDDGKKHTFAQNETVTHSVFAPGLLAALRMYGVSDNEFDEHMAFQINTIDAVKQIFKYGREAYDEGDNNIGAKMFQNKGTDTPAWLIPVEQKMEYKAKYSETKSVKNAAATAPTATYPSDASDVAGALAKKYSSGALNPSVSRRLNSMVGVTGFGKKRRSSKKRASFGKKRRSHKKRASFGKKRRSHKKRASFGKKRRSHRRSKH